MDGAPGGILTVDGTNSSLYQGSIEYTSLTSVRIGYPVLAVSTIDFYVISVWLHRVLLPFRGITGPGPSGTLYAWARYLLATMLTEKDKADH
jgi:hypothetical protein